MVNTSLVIDFVNSVDLRPYHEGLGSPAELAEWLASRGLLTGDPRVTRRDLAAAIRLREAIRDLAEGRDPGAPTAELDRAARAARLTVRFAGGEPRLEPAVGGTAGALGRIVAEVAGGMSDGSWSRIKICGADDCRWAFLDTTKNHSRAWCSMRSCGNRAKVRAYRARNG